MTIQDIMRQQGFELFHCDDDFEEMVEKVGNIARRHGFQAEQVADEDNEEQVYIRLVRPPGGKDAREL